MARAKASDLSRSRSKTAAIDELNQGIEKLQDFLAQVSDLAREGFPYRDAARARTELQLRECVRQIFGDKSPEFQSYRAHKLDVTTSGGMERTLYLIKTLIGNLEDKKLEMQGIKPALSSATGTAAETHAPVPPAPAAAPPPVTISVSLASNLASPPPPKPSVSPTAAVVATPPPPSAATPANPLSKMKHSSTSPAALSSTGPPPHPAAVGQNEQGAAAERTTTAPKATSPVPTLKRSLHAAEPPTLTEFHSTASEPNASTTGQASKPPDKDMSKDMSDESPGQSLPGGRPEQKSTARRPPSDTQTAHSVPLPATTTQPAVSTEQAGIPLNLLRKICSRFHGVARQLRLRNEYRTTLEIEDELDVQDLFYALLRVEFDEIGTEEWPPSHSGGHVRTALLLDNKRIAVIVKKTRAGLTAREIVDQLRTDAAYSSTRDGCTTLFCFVYDPEGRIGNPRSLELDSAASGTGCAIEVFVAPK